MCGTLEHVTAGARGVDSSTMFGRHSKFWKGLLAFVLAVAAAAIGGYIAERNQNTPVGRIAAILWWPFATAWTWLLHGFAWLRESAHLTHLDVMLLVVAVVALGLMAARRFWSTYLHICRNYVDLNQRVLKLEHGHLPLPPGKVVDGFDPTPLQKMAARVLLDCYPEKLQLPALTDEIEHGDPKFQLLFSRGHVASALEDMERHGVAIVDNRGEPSALYGLTRHGREFMLSRC